MSYKDYSKEAVKAIMQKIRDSRDPNKFGGYPRSSALSLDELIEAGAEIGLNSDEVKKAAGKYGHPEIVQKNEINETHLHVEKKFITSLSEQTIWEKIQAELGNIYSDEQPEKVNIHPNQYKWTHINHVNHQTVVSLEKSFNTAKLKIDQRLSFWSPQVEGMLHSTYLSLILTWIIFTKFQAEFPVLIATFTLLWSLQAALIYSLSIRARKKKLDSMEDLADQMIDQISLIDKKDL